MHGVKRLLWWLLAGSAGGVNRGRIIDELFSQPHNANDLSNVLNLDYKTIRYPGHCKSFKNLLSLGLADEKPIIIGKKKIIPREVFSALLLKNLPNNEEDVVLLKVSSEGIIKGEKKRVVYTMIDHYDHKNNITAMMRTTAYPTSIIAQLIENKQISNHGVYCPHEIVPCKPFFKEIKKRSIIINKKLTAL